MKSNLTNNIMKILLILSISLVYINCDKCQDMMTDYLMKLNPLDPTNPIMSSGLGFNDLGKYDSCIRNTNNKFVVLRILAKIHTPVDTSIPVFMGLCLPIECVDDKIFAVMKQKIAPFLKISEDNIEFIDSEKENGKYATIDASALIIMVILISYLSFASGLVKIIYDLLINEKKQKKENHSSHHSPPETDVENKNDDYKSSEEDYNVKSGSGSLISKHSKNSKGQNEETRQSVSAAININTTKETSILNLNDKVLNLFNPSEMIGTTSLKDTPEGEKKRRSKFYFILESLFDVSKNFRKIFETRVSEDKDLKIFDGLRVVTCVIIVIDHVVSLIGELPIRNPEVAYNDYFKGFKWQFLFNSIYTVDLFFSLSGFFLAYMTLKNLKEFKKATVPQILMNIALRLLRIWPIYTLIFLFYWKFYIYFMDGPISGYVFNKELDSCAVQWPYMLTLLTNFTYGVWETGYPYCMSWYWYIPNDFQYSIIAIFLLVVYAKSRRTFYFLFTIVNLAFWGAEAYVIWNIDFGVNLYDLGRDDNFYKYYYMKFYTRSSPFWIGMLFGVIYSKYKRDVASHTYSKIRNFIENVKDSKIVSLILYFFGLGIMMSLTFCTYWSYDTKWSFTARFLYNFLGKKLYVFGLFIFCLPLMLGNLYILGGWLGHAVFLPLAKLSFSVYIIHPLLVKLVIFNIRTPMFFNGTYIVLLGLSFAISSYFLSVFVCTLFEMPFQNIRDLFKKRARAHIHMMGSHNTFKKNSLEKELASALIKNEK